MTPKDWYAVLIFQDRCPKEHIFLPHEIQKNKKSMQTLLVPKQLRIGTFISFLYLFLPCSLIAKETSNLNKNKNKNKKNEI